MLYEIKGDESLNKIKDFFNDIRFFMGKSVLDGMMGNAYVDNISNPSIAFLTVRKYCFISGNIEKEKFKQIIDEQFKSYKLIPSDGLSKELEEIYKDNIIKSYRYSIKKDPVFNIQKLEDMSNDIKTKYGIVKIDKEMANRIKNENFINITDDYENNGIGFVAFIIMK